LNNADEPAVEPKEESVPDISLLSPEQQDRYQELADKLLADESSPDETEELNQLLKALPLVGPREKFSGPDLEIPDPLVFHFKWTEQRGKLPYRFFEFHRLKAVQKVRFVELCRKYGWSDGQNAGRTLPRLHEWSPHDRAEMNGLLDAAADAHTARRSQASHARQSSQRF
jgi:hypothetical protein